LARRDANFRASPATTSGWSSFDPDPNSAFRRNLELQARAVWFLGPVVCHITYAIPAPIFTVSGGTCGQVSFRAQSCACDACGHDTEALRRDPEGVVPGAESFGTVTFSHGQHLAYGSALVDPRKQTNRRWPGILRPVRSPIFPASVSRTGCAKIRPRFLTRHYGAFQLDTCEPTM
jgi:hypothetical protein